MDVLLCIICDKIGNYSLSRLITFSMLFIRHFAVYSLPYLSFSFIAPSSPSRPKFSWVAILLFLRHSLHAFDSIIFDLSLPFHQIFLLTFCCTFQCNICLPFCPARPLAQGPTFNTQVKISISLSVLLSLLHLVPLQFLVSLLHIFVPLPTMPLLIFIHLTLDVLRLWVYFLMLWLRSLIL